MANVIPTLGGNKPPPPPTPRAKQSNIAAFIAKGTSINSEFDMSPLLHQLPGKKDIVEGIVDKNLDF